MKMSQVRHPDVQAAGERHDEIQADDNHVRRPADDKGADDDHHGAARADGLQPGSLVKTGLSLCLSQENTCRKGNFRGHKCVRSSIRRTQYVLQKNMCLDTLGP